jgi:hypothetical protein
MVIELGQTFRKNLFFPIFVTTKYVSGIFCRDLGWSFVIFYYVEKTLLLTKHYSGDKIKKIEMGRACSTYGEENRFIQGFGGET